MVRIQVVCSQQQGADGSVQMHVLAKRCALTCVEWTVRSVAVMPLSFPPKAPKGVRFALTMTILLAALDILAG